MLVHNAGSNMYMLNIFNTYDSYESEKVMTAKEKKAMNALVLIYGCQF